MTAPDRRRVHVLVAGRVQGVYYRASTQETATGLGLGGWVRNLPDGRVELEAEGATGAIEQLLRWLRQGPPAARVQDLDVREQAPAGAGSRFEIRR